MTVLVQKECIGTGKSGIAGYRTSEAGIRSISYETKLTILLIALLALLALVTQFLLCELDDNRLLSWQWVMSRGDLLTILLFSAAGFFAAYKSSVVRLSEKQEIACIIACGFVVGMATWPIPEFMVDTGRYFTHAKLFATQGIGYFLSEWGYGINAWTDMPLASAIYGSVFYVFGESRMAIQIVNTTMFSGAVYLTYLIGKELWSSRVGIYAAWFLLAIPFLHVQVSQMLVDVPAMFFTVLAIYLSATAVKKSGNGWLLLASAAIIFALLTKYSVWIALIPIAFLPLTFKGHDRAEAIGRLGTLALITSVLLLFVFYVHHPVLFKQLKILLDYQLPALQRWQESYISTFFYQVHPFVTLAALASVVYAVRKKELVYLIPACALFVMLVLGVYRARYLVIVFPLLALIAAFGINQFKQVILKQFIVRSAVVASLAVTIFANLNFLGSTSSVNLKDAGNYLNSLREGNVVAVVLPQRSTVVNPEIALPIVDYYTHKNIYRADNEKVAGLLDMGSSSISPLRFTWEVNQYPYPVADDALFATHPAIILISGYGKEKIPLDVKQLLSSYERDRTFAVSDRVFRFQTAVTVYRYNNISS